MHSDIYHMPRKREGTIGINVIIIFVLVILVLALTISILTKGSSSLGIFSDVKVEQDDETLIGELISLTDKNYVNINANALKNGATVGFEIISPVAITIADCSASPSDYCNYISLSVSNSSPKYTYIPEGVTIDISYNNDSVYGSSEGYATITVPGLYEINKTILQSGNELALCNNSLVHTCYVYNAAPPVATVNLRVTLGQNISVRLPFYYDNLANSNTGVADEKTCTDKPEYSNIEAQVTKLNVKVEGPSYPYDITVVHMEKSHEREYAQYCGDSIPNDTPVSFDVQVVSGDYDFFRIYGWNGLNCVNSIEDIPVKKDTTKDVTLRFNC
ncbi:MAG: hypothetical protein KAJ20_02265 [Candidatus Aenigmarchaeota archaeon]|nr:hypothetical protein [Candidatus Aenigmarchaeota archaeon]MCK5373135.1 hypothetical protein [Candidatus Aenigmarchaeota archaeon]